MLTAAKNLRFGAICAFLLLASLTEPAKSERQNQFAFANGECQAKLDAVDIGCGGKASHASLDNGRNLVNFVTRELTTIGFAGAAITSVNETDTILYLDRIYLNQRQLEADGQCTSTHSSEKSSIECRAISKDGRQLSASITSSEPTPMFLQATKLTTQPSTSPSVALPDDCKKLSERADLKFRYLLCSGGLYDREVKGFLLSFDGRTVQLTIAQFKDRGFRTGVVPVPKKFETLIHPFANEQKVLVWADEKEPIFIVTRHVEKTKTHYYTHIVSSKFVDTTNLSLNSKPEASIVPNFRKTCRWGEGMLTCPFKIAKTNEGGSYYYAGVSNPDAPNLIEMIVLEHSQPTISRR